MAEDGGIHDVEDFRASGLLWLFNRAVLHPRGFALAWHYDDDGEFIGWSIIGDGTEVFSYSPDHVDENALLRKVEDLLDSHRPRITDAT